MGKITRTYIFFIMFFLGCSSNYVQSTNNIAKFKTEVIPYDKSLLLCKITGNSMDSALYIKSYELVYNIDNVHIYINKSLKKTGISFPYFIQFIISKNINYVYLGDSEIIWRRE
ncbi:MAG TPA: hypothetical protein P5123_03720 [Spirochaetota bacterium]|nr:hypothetical protein [Spirochaetota bacterium]